MRATAMAGREANPLKPFQDAANHDPRDRPMAVREPSRRRRLKTMSATAGER
jgi:hypothetical protein